MAVVMAWVIAGIILIFIALAIFACNTSQTCAHIGTRDTVYVDRIVSPAYPGYGSCDNPRCLVYHFSLADSTIFKLWFDSCNVTDTFETVIIDTSGKWKRS